MVIEERNAKRTLDKEKWDGNMTSIILNSFGQQNVNDQLLEWLDDIK